MNRQEARVHIWGSLERIEQCANESGTGEMGLLDTIHNMHRYAREALQDEVRLNRNTP